MGVTGIQFFNSYYPNSPAAVLKLAELMFGAGAWGPVIVVPVSTSGPFSFYLWCTFSSWILVLLSYLLGLCKLSVRPKNPAEWRRYHAPQLGDLCLNATIALLYIPSIVVYGVYSFPLPTFGGNSPVFVLILAIVTFLIHAFHASSAVLYFMMGDVKWQNEKRWIWQRPIDPKKPVQGAVPRKYEAATASEGYENPEPVEESAHATAQRTQSDIYQDVR